MYLGRVFGFPLTLDPSALLLIALYTLRPAQAGPAGLVQGILTALVIFSSVLIHELGHALIARYFQFRDISITLHGFGGWTSYVGWSTPGRGLLVSLAGPALELLFGLVLLPLLWIVPEGRLWEIVELAVRVNLFWSLFNLLPIFPLDGGNMLYHGLSFVIARERALMWAARVGAVLAILLGVAAWSFGFHSTLIIVAMMLYRSVPIALGRA